MIFLRMIVVTFLFIGANHDSYSQFISAKKIYEKCADGVVLITTSSGSLGTGFFVSKDGWIITNHHVVRDYYGRTVAANSITVTTRDKRTYTCSVIDDTKDYQNLDIALLKINGLPSVVLPFAITDAPVGEDVVAIGHPQGLTWSQTKGTVTKNKFGDDDNQFYLQIDVAVNSGNSGGPLINSKGQVCGVITWKRIDMDNTNYAIRPAWVKSVLQNRGISFSTTPIVNEGMNEFEQQFEEFKQEREFFSKEKESFLQEKLKYEKFINEEKQKLFNDRQNFERSKQESTVLIEHASALRTEFENQKRALKRLEEELEMRKEEIVKKENWIRQKEIEINTKLTPRLAFELQTLPGYLSIQQSELSTEYGIFRASAGLFIRFGIDRNNYGEVKGSDKVGLVYSWNKVLDFDESTFTSGYVHDLGLAVEFSEIFRLALGTNFPTNNISWKSQRYYYTGMSLNFITAPIQFGMNVSAATDIKFTKQQYGVGLFLGYSVNFLRW